MAVAPPCIHINLTPSCDVARACSALDDQVEDVAIGFVEEAEHGDGGVGVPCINAPVWTPSL